ncbi:hypothetical protein CONCODRAFT_3830 [Conidiobolus coronatus NRRL 28638]|uniref:Glycogen debranching enzyme C-terminal domain-containing protein n=1 Tax=Conidiobolus coronatus (strain ATCC 28846 / CBS 209.66 / NRRL 28638) TaxID=796925 RepID=A0A137PDT5_CONC2|nr:hypothetical protein CONCODRAFT_3830 [Conidiobolus coronatus NRRL 28638]|eukprot:KXN73166.1 hypothetical protein CONCODRAFT_3830 [Conidiobolus coronatus NRRL 28638]
MAAYHFRSQFASQQFPPSLLIHEIQERFVGFKDELLYSLFAGIPELTNSNGNYCRDSYASQAWSTATALDALFSVYLNSKKVNNNELNSFIWLNSMFNMIPSFNEMSESLNSKIEPSDEIANNKL